MFCLGACRVLDFMFFHAVFSFLRQHPGCMLLHFTIQKKWEPMGNRTPTFRENAALSCPRADKKVKVTLVQALGLCTGRTAHRGSRGIALPFHDHGTRRGCGVSVTPRPLFTPGKEPGVKYRRLGGKGSISPRKIFVTALCKHCLLFQLCLRFTLRGS